MSTLIDHSAQKFGVRTFASAQTELPKLLMVAHYCSPDKGSDWWVGWSRALQAAEHFRVWVVTSTQSRPDIERFIERNGPIPNLTFVYQGLDPAGRLFSRIPVSFLYVNPFSYGSWQKQAAKLAKRLHSEHCFDLTHHVNLLGFREPGTLWELDVPFIWGPIGGTQFCPWKFLGTAGLADFVKEAGRSAANWLQLRYSRKVHRALKNAAVVLVANSDGKRQLGRYRPDSIQLLETGLDFVRAKRTNGAPGQPLRILWSGEIQFRKALHLLLQAVAQIRGTIDFELRILGKGAGLKKAQAMAQKLGLSEKCRFLGWIPLEDAREQSTWADVFVFTSLRDTSGNVMLEAMSRGVPVITFDHQGAGDIVTSESGIKIPVTSPADAVNRLSDAIAALAKDREWLARLSQGAALRAEHFLWQRNAAAMAKVYRSALKTRTIRRAQPIPARDVAA